MSPPLPLRAPAKCDFPIWPCSVRGFACHRCCHRRGALLPHLFTLTCLRPCGRRRAVYFLCHFPSSCPDRALPGALPCGVRTFLSPTLPGGRRRTIIWPTAAETQLILARCKY